MVSGPSGKQETEITAMDVVLCSRFRFCFRCLIVYLSVRYESPQEVGVMGKREASEPGLLDKQVDSYRLDMILFAYSLQCYSIKPDSH